MSDSDQDQVKQQSSKEDAKVAATEAVAGAEKATKPKTVRKKPAAAKDDKPKADQPAAAKKATATKKAATTKKSTTVKTAAKKPAAKTTKAASTKASATASKAAPKAKAASTTRAKAKTSEAAATKAAAVKAKSKKVPEIEQYTAIGRRKSATARVYMRPGRGQITINGKTLDVYFGRETARMVVCQPLELLDVATRFDIVVNVSGSGVSGQAGAIRHGITRALLKYEEANSDKIPQQEAAAQAQPGKAEVETDGEAGVSGAAATADVMVAGANAETLSSVAAAVQDSKRNKGWRLKLRKAGFVTRDARCVERKKVGRRKARRSTQFSKR